MATALSLLSQGVSANPASELFRTEAIDAWQHGEVSYARNLADRAVAADIGDQRARYYRAVLRSRLGDYGEALGDLERVDGDLFPDYDFELGYLLYRLQRSAEALMAFSRVAELQPDRAPAHYYLGVIHYQQQAYQAALAPLESAARLDGEYAPSADTLRADALIHLGRSDEAALLIATAQQLHADTVYAAPLAEMAERLQPAGGRRLQFILNAGVAHDSNVGLFADDQILPADVDSEADTRLQAAVEARGLLYRGEQREIGAAYRLFATHHASLSDYDLINHELSASYRGEQSWGALLGDLELHHTTLGGEPYNRTLSLTPAVTLRHNARQLSLLRLNWRTMRYSSDLAAGRDGTYRELGYSHFRQLSGAANLFASLRIGSNGAEAAEYDYRLAGVRIGGSRQLTHGKLKASLGVEQRRYEERVPVREDRATDLAVDYLYPVSQQLELDASLVYIDHSSTWASYAYDRNLFTVSIRWMP